MTHRGYALSCANGKDLTLSIPVELTEGDVEDVRTLLQIVQRQLDRWQTAERRDR